MQLVSLDNIGAATYNLGGTLENFDKIEADRQLKSVLMLKSVKRPNSSRPISWNGQHQVGEFLKLANGWDWFVVTCQVVDQFTSSLCFATRHILPDVDVALTGRGQKVTVVCEHQHI